jgi:hypothetical protein
MNMAAKFDDLIMPEDKQKVTNFALIRGYVPGEGANAGKWINRNAVAADIKKNIEKFKKDLEAALGVKDTGVDTLENEWGL